MGYAYFNIDSSQIQLFKQKLEKIHRSAVPVAVRQSLNEAAYQMKSVILPSEFKNDFTIRRPTFVKSHSAFTRSKNTFEIQYMSSECGIIRGKSISGNRLELQERGGVVSDRAVPINKNGVSPTRMNERNESKQSAIYYYRKFRNAKKGVIMRNRKRTIIKTDDYLFEVRAGGEWRTLYVLNSTARIKPKRFIEPAGTMAASRIPYYFIRNAQKKLSQL